MANLKIIRDLCRERRIPLNELAEKLNIRQSGLQRILSKNSTKIETLEKIAEILNVNVSIFFSDAPTEEFQIQALGDILDKAPDNYYGLKILYDIINGNSKLQETINELEILNKIKDRIISFLLQGNKLPSQNKSMTFEEDMVFDDFVSELHNILINDVIEGKESLTPDVPYQVLNDIYRKKGDQNFDEFVFDRLKKKSDAAYRKLFSIPQIRQIFQEGKISTSPSKSLWDEYASNVEEK